MSESNGKLAAALLAAQKDMPAVEPDATNPHFKSKFVSLGHLIAKVRPVLNKHGLAFAQFPSRSEDGSPTLVTILMHESGERLQAEAPLLLPKQDPQGQGSAITYMRRYALASALGISDQEDDDGNAGSTSPQDGGPTTGGKGSDSPSGPQLEVLKTTLSRKGSGVEAVDVGLVVEWAKESREMKRKDCSEALDALFGKKGDKEKIKTRDNLVMRAKAWDLKRVDPMAVTPEFEA